MDAFFIQCRMQSNEKWYFVKNSFSFFQISVDVKVSNSIHTWFWIAMVKRIQYRRKPCKSSDCYFIKPEMHMKRSEKDIERRKDSWKDKHTKLYACKWFVSSQSNWHLLYSFFFFSSILLFAQIIQSSHSAGQWQTRSTTFHTLHYTCILVMKKWIHFACIRPTFMLQSGNGVSNWLFYEFNSIGKRCLCFYLQISLEVWVNLLNFYYPPMSCSIVCVSVNLRTNVFFYMANNW